MHRWIWGLLALAACESGLARQVEVTVPAEIANGFTATAPGVVRSDLGSSTFSYTLLCGQTSQSKLTLEQDLGFGCLSKTQEGSSETVKVWVEPMPATWDAASLCAARTDRRFYEATHFSPAPDAGTTDAGSADAGASDAGTVDAGDTDGLQLSPDPAWVQGSGSGTWHRDGSPCGGSMNVKLTLAKP